jgi:hypothetical protein
MSTRAEIAEFEKWEDWWFRTGIKDVPLGTDPNEAIMAKVDELWPDPQKIARFWDWFDAKSDSFFSAAMKPASVKDIIHQINQDMRAVENVARLAGILDQGNKSFFPVGHGLHESEYHGYCLATSASILKPHSAVPCDGMEYESGFLGINVDLQPQTIHIQERSDLPGGAESSAKSGQKRTKWSSTISKEARSKGFCFHQLGALLRYDGDWPQVKTDSVETAENKWSDTGFVVVVEVSSAGRAGKVFVIYNTFQDMDSKGNRTEIDTSLDNKWGFLSSTSKERFFVAKIADKIEDLGMGYKFKFDVVNESVCWIVGLKSAERTVTQKFAEQPMVQKLTPIRNIIYLVGNLAYILTEWTVEKVSNTEKATKASKTAKTTKIAKQFVAPPPQTEGAGGT